MAVAATDSTSPPLPEPRHRRVVQSHFRVEAPDPPAHHAQAKAKFRLFPRDQRSAVSARRFECFGPHERVAPGSLGLADRSVPLHVAKPVVDRPTWVKLPSSTAGNRDVLSFRKESPRCLKPAGYQDAVTVDKLDKADVGIQ